MVSCKIVALWFRSRILRSSAARWDYQYTVGKWEKLKTEQPRLTATALFLKRHVPVGRVLEIGCGEALLQQQLDSSDYARWVGVDLSAIAIDRATAFSSEKARYVLADMEIFVPDDQFDAIVFTESIYYSANCARLLSRYAQFLTPQGLFIISICRTKRSDRIWKDINSVTTTIDATVTAGEAATWDCEVCSPT